jgi:hypothetical protein
MSLLNAIAAFYSCEFLKINSPHTCKRFRCLFNKYEKEKDFKGIGKAIELKLRDRNKIVEKWPLRLRRGVNKEDCDIILASGHVGSERYVEWEIA